MASRKKIAIVGFGKEGVATANYFSKSGELFIFDKKPKEEINPEILKKLKFTNVGFFTMDNIPAVNFDLVVRTPGIRTDDPILNRLAKNGARRTSHIKIFFDKCPAQIIGVTGTKGKGTTATLIYEMLKTRSHNVYLAGNIGTPALEILPKLNKNSNVILELSSFQLMDLKKSPHVAVVLMVTSEHLDWHVDNGEYLSAKANIVKFQNRSDYAVINADYPNSLKIAKFAKSKIYQVSTRGKIKGTYFQNGYIYSNIIKPEKIINADEIQLPGKHNIQNAMAAISVARILGISTANIKQVLTTFKGLKHRLQLVAVKNGVRYYNDSYSTTPETAIAALNAFACPKTIILGGSGKNSDFSTLAKTIANDHQLKAIILIGSEAPKIKSAIQKSGGFKGSLFENLKSMKDIVKTAAKISQKGEVVILSPACASFDMFKNYADRGEQFEKEVKLLK